MLELRTALEQVTPTSWSKYQALLAAMRDGQPFRWEPTDPEDRLVIFTERIATLNWPRARLTEDLSLKPGEVETLHGGMSDVDQQRVVEDFGNTQRPVRLLICSDVASEVPGLEPDEVVFVFSGLVPNLKSHPLVYEWIAVSFRGSEFSESIPFKALIGRTGVRHGAVPNLGQATDTGSHAALRLATGGPALQPRRHRPVPAPSSACARTTPCCASRTGRT